MMGILPPTQPNVSASVHARPRRLLRQPHVRLRHLLPRLHGLTHHRGRHRRGVMIRQGPIQVAEPIRKELPIPRNAGAARHRRIINRAITAAIGRLVVSRLNRPIKITVPTLQPTIINPIRKTATVSLAELLPNQRRRPKIPEKTARMVHLKIARAIGAIEIVTILTATVAATTTIHVTLVRRLARQVIAHFPAITLRQP